MTRRRVPLVLLIVPLVLAGCAQLGFLRGGADAPAPEVEVAVMAPDAAEPRPQARPRGGVQGLGAAGVRPEALDRTSPEERQAALAPPAARTQLLGTTLASLGSPGESGLWLRTGLVTQVRPGRIELADGGGTLRVELRPSGAAAGAGSQLSLASFTTLGLPLTQLVNLRVFAE